MRQKYPLQTEGNVDNRRFAFLEKNPCLVTAGADSRYQKAVPIFSIKDPAAVPIKRSLSCVVLVWMLLVMWLGASPNSVWGASRHASFATEASPLTQAEEPAKPASDSEVKSGAADPAEQKQEGRPEVGRTPSHEEFWTLGSLSPDGRHRYLATFSSTGAALVRLELNARDGRGNYAYRDLEHFGGYLGKLELAPVENGMRVGCVGEGTPAYGAGLRAGDVVVKINGEPVVSGFDFERIRQKVPAGDQLVMEVLPGAPSSAPATLTIPLTDQPLELLSREIDFVDTGVISPPSFLMQLRAIVSDNEWKPVAPEMKTGTWLPRKFVENDREYLEFSYEITESVAKEAGLSGPCTVIKRFSLPILPPAEAANLDSRSFDIRLDLIVRTPAGSPVLDVGVELDGPTGATTEGWWYQNKIHGRSTALFYIAGARDVISSTAGSTFNFRGCPEIVDKTLKSSNVQYIVEKPKLQGADQSRNELKFLSVDTQYFNISLLPRNAETNSEQPYHCYSALAYVASTPIQKGSAKYARKVDCSFMLFDRIQVPAGGDYQQSFEIFAGPKKTSVLESYGLENTRVFGWFGWFSQVLCWLLRALYWVTFKTSYGLAIILLTILVRLTILPLSRKAAKNAQMMQLLAPEMKAITEKYKDDLEKRGLAQRELFKRHNYNPAAGCLPALLQIPILIGLYKGLSVDIALRDQPLFSGLNWCSNLAAPDKLFYWKDYLWSALGSETGWLGPYFNILPIITIVLFLIQQKMFTPPPTDEQQAITQKMMTYMMFFMGIMFFKVPAGLCIYFITSSLWGIMERKLLPKPQLSEAKLNEIRANSGGATLALPEKRSLFSKPDLNRPAKPGSSAPGGFMDRVREAIDAAQKKNSTIVNSEKERANRDKTKRPRGRDR